MDKLLCFINKDYRYWRILLWAECHRIKYDNNNVTCFCVSDYSLFMFRVIDSGDRNSEVFDRGVLCGV